MSLSLTGFVYTIFYVPLLLVNAMAILSEDRFLARIGWSGSQQQGAPEFQGYDQQGFGAAQTEPGMKSKLIDLISAVRTLLRIPLIGLNIVFIIYEMLLA